MTNLFDNNSGAEFSEDGKHRYKLWRIWDAESPKAMCIGLNPSKANANKNDATINNLIGMLKKLGYGGFYMVNCWSYITPKPELLKTNPMADEWNNNVITVTASLCDDVIFAWGDFKIIRERGRDKELIEMFPRAKCFGRNKSGSPFHPRALTYIKGALENPQLLDYNTLNEK